MKISTRLKLAELLCIVVVVAIAIVLFFTTRQVERELVQNERAGEILRGATALRYLSLEYALHHEPRTLSQWQLRSTSLAKQMDAYAELVDARDVKALDDIRRSRDDLRKSFMLLVDTRRERDRDLSLRDVLAELEVRLLGQITNRSQAMISGALALSESSRHEVLDAQQRANAVVVAFGLLVMLVVTAIIYVTIKSVTGPLERMRHGTQVVGAGNLNVSLNIQTQDEIGELARAFDDMTEKLRQTTVSRDELAKTNAALQTEMGVRQAAENKVRAHLGRLNLLQQITRSIGERLDLRSIYQVVVRTLESQLPIDFGCIFLYDRPQNALTVTCLGTQGLALAQALGMPENSRVDIDENGLSRCVRGQLVYEADVAEVAFPFPQRLAAGGLRSVVMAPLLAESTVFGILVAARREPSGFSSGDCEFLQQLSEHVALAANQAQLYGALQQAYDDLRQTQQSVLQQERLRALGQMASGIAHDINNAISPLALYTESLLETEKGLSPKGRGYLEVIERSIDDVAATVARMREFYRQREPQRTLAPVNANALVRQVVDLTRARWSDMPQRRGIVIALRTDLAADLPLFMGAEGEIREALTNLVFNAVDAMPEGGTLTLRTGATTEDASPGTAEAPRQVFIEVSDSGVGMDEATRRRCLEPFFTTKGERGTGLGLAMVYGMIERHSADIHIDSALLQGTTVRISFLTPAASLEPATAYSQETARMTRQILIVDDDPIVLKALRDILEADGHTVVATDGGQAGIDAFQSAHQQGKPFDLVITDLGMPHVDGHKVAAAIKAQSPSTPIILLTGWGQRLATDDGNGVAHVDHVLGKPPKLREVRRTLAAVFPNAEA